MSPTESENLRLYQTLGQIESKVDALLQDRLADSRRLAAVEDRVSKLDLAHAKYLGMAAVLGLVIGILAPLISNAVLG